MRNARLTDGCRDILAEAESDARAFEEAQPADPFTDQEFADNYLAALNAETHDRYMARLAACEAEIGPLELAELCDLPF